LVSAVKPSSSTWQIVRMVIKDPKELQLSIKNIFVAAGINESNTDCVTEHMVASQLCGVDTHGMFHTSLYLDGLRNGQINPTATPSILQETPNTAQITGNWTFRQVVAGKGMISIVMGGGYCVDSPRTAPLVEAGMPWTRIQWPWKRHLPHLRR